ncbi:MAG: prepilin-type N-terminal cleavage/methylation domain-containing protein [Campylobacterota bacterium]|nr:prepilin-type N-terminal cleavage/methylation domain-containing protein [Campylobacterota bacterium]
MIRQISSWVSVKNSPKVMHQTRYYPYRDRPAFSLLELMIVILIISFSYLLIFSSMQKTQEKPKALQITDLKSSLKEQNLLHADSELFCLDKCQKCYIYQDGKSTLYGGELALGDLMVYDMDSDGNLKKVDFGRFQDHAVCIRFKYYHNGSSSQMVVKNSEGIYYLSSFFAEPVRVDSLDSAEELWVAHADELADSGEYY